MTRWTSCFLLASATCAALLTPEVSAGANLTWAVDSTQSTLSLSIPVQPLKIQSLSMGNALLGNQGAAAGGSWTVGNQAAIGGTLVTDWTASTIQFPLGAHALVAQNSGVYTPDLDTWNSTSKLYVPANSSASAAFGGQLNTSQIGALPVVFEDAARFAIRDVLYELSSGVIPISSGVFAAGQTSFGFDDGEIGARGGTTGSLTVPSLNASLSDVGLAKLSTNGAGNGTITAPDPFQPLLRKLTLPINIPISLNLYGSALDGTAQGSIVAYAVVPEPASWIGFFGGMLTIFAFRFARGPQISSAASGLRRKN